MLFTSNKASSSSSSSQQTTTSTAAAKSDGPKKEGAGALNGVGIVGAKKGIVVYNGDDDGGVGECDDEDLRLLESMGSSVNAGVGETPAKAARSNESQAGESETGSEGTDIFIRIIQA